MNEAKQDDQYSKKETKRRMESALRRALTTPPKTHKEITRKKSQPNPATNNPRANSLYQ
ncbi:MAG TPA: hypothetical protein VFC54_00355 [Pseudolabrys sp.]|nr:hypothetical protein [Pseudolabrys sp.]